MSEANSTPVALPNKPARPDPDFPLFAHAAGVWARKRGSELHYFSRWDNPDAALARYLDQKEALHASRTPRLNSDIQPLKVFATKNCFRHSIWTHRCLRSYCVLPIDHRRQLQLGSQSGWPS